MGALLFQAHIEPRKDIPFYTDMCKRSVFNLIGVIQDVRVLENCRWQYWTDPLATEYFKAKAKLPLTSKAVEDAVRVLRRQETCSSNNDSSCSRMYAALIDSPLIDQSHRFTTMDWHNQWVKRDAAAPSCSAALYTPSVADANRNFDCKGIRSGKGAALTPDWYTTTVANQLKQVGDLYLARHLNRFNEWDKAENVWLSTLFRPNMIVNKKGEAVWYCPLASLGNHGCVAARCNWVDTEDDVHHFAFEVTLPDEFNEVDVIFPLELDQWQARSMRWQSPLERKLKGKPGPANTTIAFVPTSGPLPVDPGGAA